MLHDKGPVPTLTATIVISDPENEFGPFDTYTYRHTASRKTLGSNKRCSIYKHKVELYLGPITDEPPWQVVEFTGRSHVPVDPFNRMASVIRLIRYSRDHINQKPRGPGGTPLPPPEEPA